MLGAYRAAAAVALGLTAVFALQSYLAAFYSTFADVTIDVLAAVAVVSAALAMLKYGRGVRTQSGRIWPSFTIGLFMWFIAEIIFSVYYDVLGVSLPYPSLADVFYVGGYVPLFVGLYLYVRYFASLFTRRVLALVAVFVLVVGVLSLWLWSDLS